MPALRRFLKKFFPICFGTTAKDYNYRHHPLPDISTKKPNAIGTAPKMQRVGYPSMGITKTSETMVESMTREDDEIQLVGMQQGKMAG